MFTGLIQDIGSIERVSPGGMTDLWVRTALGAERFALGESIAVSGVCLTVVERGADRFRVQVSPETLRRTTVGGFRPGTRVNLERALALSDRLGGHLVQGHVDGVTELLERRSEGDSVVMRLALPPELAAFFIDKGSVCLDGVSLTVNTVERDAFSVALIPETLQRTCLDERRPGDRLNLEADVIGKYVARLHGLRSAPGPLTQQALKDAGFGTGN